MAWEEHKPGNSDNGTAFTTIPPRAPVALGGTAPGVNGLLVTNLATNSQEAIGFTGLGTTASGAQVMFYLEEDQVQAVAGASFGPGADMMLSHIAASAPMLVPAAGASAAIVASGHFILGKSRMGGAAGDIFTLHFKPRKA